MSKPSAQQRLSVPGKIAFSVVPLLLLLGGGELVARLSGKDFSIKRFFYIAGGHEEYYGTSKLSVPYQAHPPYYWTGQPKAGFFNSDGFRGREWILDKPPGTTRIAIMGCSCTLGGQEPYADRIERVLRQALGEEKYDVLNFGIGSSSTHQVLQILQNHTLKFKPDVATLFSGWNDRWVHDGRRDAQHKLPSATSAGLWDFLTGHSQLFKAMVYRADTYGNAKPQQRVPPADYARNLRRFVKICRDHNIRPVLCTTPDGLPASSVLDRFNENKKKRDWDSDLFDLYKDKADDPIAVWNYIQKLYNDTVKEVAADENVDLIDLDAEVAARRKLYEEPPFFFFKDGIHFAELGLQELAGIYARHLVRGDDRDRLAAYLDSPAYYLTNAYQFARQYQFYVADEFIRRGEALQGAPYEGINDLRTEISSNETFYTTFDMARIELSNRGDYDKAEVGLKQALDMRPDEHNIRLELAKLAYDRGQYEKCINYALGEKVNYKPENLYKALWMGVEAANALRRSDLVIKILQDIRRLFPQDERARQILAQAGM
ncbi:MAG: GDSL-type esterase/lipase family protein [bacterium]